MHPPEKLSQARVAILGLGLMGGSLALALRGHCAGLSAMDINPEIVKLAQATGVVDYAAADPQQVLTGADLVVLAAPVRVIIAHLGRLSDWHPGQAVVLDLGSTKTDILAAMDALPPRFDPLGGHPMCGREYGGLTNADAGLFKDAPFALSSLPRTSPRARHLVDELIQLLGAIPLYLSADLHDRLVAATSHLPYLLAIALAAATPPQAERLVGPGLRSTTRLAATPLSIMQDILMTNRSNIIETLHIFQAQLDDLVNYLQSSDWSRLYNSLERGRENYEAFIVNNS